MTVKMIDTRQGKSKLPAKVLTLKDIEDAQQNSLTNPFTVGVVKALASR